MKSMQVPMLCRIAMLLLIAGVAGADEERTFEAYPLTTPDPEPLIEAARELVGNQGRVIYERTGHQLLVSTTAGSHRQLAALLAQVNVPAVNIRIDVVTEDSGSSHDTGASIGIDGTIPIPSSKGPVSVVVKPSIHHRSTKTSDNTRQSLVVMSGGTASLEIGREVPQVNWLIERGRHWGYIQADIQVRQVGASLRIQPRLLGNSGRVAIRLIPELSVLTGDGNIRQVQFINVATEVVALDGQTVTFGGFDQNKDFYDRFLIGFRDGGNQRRVQLSLTPHIMR